MINSSSTHRSTIFVTETAAVIAEVSAVAVEVSAIAAEISAVATEISAARMATKTTVAIFNEVTLRTDIVFLQ